MWFFSNAWLNYCNCEYISITNCFSLTADESGATYQWLNCQVMTPIEGAINQTYTATTNEDFAVIVTNNGCSDTSGCYTIMGVGLVKNDFGNQLKL